MTDLLTKVRRIAVLHHGAESTARAVDAWSAEDDVSADIASTEALESACEAVLAAAGAERSQARPLVRRLSRERVTAPWCDLVSRLLTKAGPPSREVAEERLRVAGLLLSWCTLEGWDGPLLELPGPPERSGGAGPRRSPYFTPVRLRAGWALIGPGRDVELPERALRLWRELDGRPLSDVLSVLRAHDPLERLEDTAATVTWLVGRGAVQVPAPARAVLTPTSAYRALPC
ncbi:hypothetical protein [Umezawaea tangerina]|uniref:Uncharacterized protein n=1 Tax=Umezawaea tangerina TaxID=84725 RepID=A0A2T0T9I3_9PSEU|nr:hypothetical protein [Umezawaea tangerina]PRY42327.1 hypothetical protein CLV43_104157 [Umezawaea tangerina]